ncbi:hypothetical protein TNCV_360931 [Trichonephila clavipes]|nr:hypothetical protein TNCV_360931 [Trichonephila clavipes]
MARLRLPSARRVRFASARCTGRKRRSVAMHFTCGASSDTGMVEFKAPNHLMILFPAKINFPEYDDIIDMFNVRTPISPLPPTPVASPSHEQSQDAIYDSLPTMVQSTVPKSPLKEHMEPSTIPKSSLKDPVDSKPPIVSKSPDPSVKAHVKKVDSVIHCSPRSREKRNEERRNEERRNEERRPRDPRMYRRPDFRPSY